MQYMYDKELVLDIIEDMINASNKIKNRCSKFNSAEDFLDNEDSQIVLDSICMQLIAIGEAVKEIDKITKNELLSKYKQVQWKKVAGIRDILLHHYFDLNAEIIFSVCVDHIENLFKTLTIIQNELNEIR